MEHICETCQYYTPNTGGQGCQCPKIIFGYYGRLPIGDEVMIEYDEGWGCARPLDLVVYIGVKYETC